MTISTPPWIVRAWPPVLWPLQTAEQLQFVHLGTRVTCPAGAGQPSAGQTLWGGRIASLGSAGVAWDWVELCEGVFAMSDPLGLVTNLQLLDVRGDPIVGLEAALRLNQIVNLLPWQGEVERAMALVVPSGAH